MRVRFFIRIFGLIVEYNTMDLSYLYHLEEAKKITQSNQKRIHPTFIYPRKKKQHPLLDFEQRISSLIKPYIIRPLKKK